MSKRNERDPALRLVCGDNERVFDTVADATKFFMNEHTVETHDAKGNPKTAKRLHTDPGAAEKIIAELVTSDDPLRVENSSLSGNVLQAVNHTTINVCRHRSPDYAKRIDKTLKHLNEDKGDPFDHEAVKFPFLSDGRLNLTPGDDLVSLSCTGLLTSSPTSVNTPWHELVKAQSSAKAAIKKATHEKEEGTDKSTTDELVNSHPDISALEETLAHLYIKADTEERARESILTKNIPATKEKLEARRETIAKQINAYHATCERIAHHNQAVSE